MSCSPDGCCYGYSPAYDRLVWGLSDDIKTKSEDKNDWGGIYDYIPFNYCPFCGNKLVRK